MNNIEHVIYYMLENRSFDNLLGWLYDDSSQPKHLIASDKLSDKPFYGLEENKFFNCFKGEDTKHFVKKGTHSLQMPDPDPHEEYAHMTYQLFGHSDPTEGEIPTMSGYLDDYAQLSGIKSHGVVAKLTDVFWSGTSNHDNALQILNTYTPEQLPIINGLAKHYAVSDHYFASVPSQTNCNRAFSLCGTSEGLVNNANGPFKARNIWDVLTENGYSTPDDWMIYYQSKTTQLHWEFWKDEKFCYIEETFVVPDQKNHVADIDQFFAAAKAGKLPAFSYLEPNWIGMLDGAIEATGKLAGEVASGLGGEDARRAVTDKIATDKPNSYHPPSEVSSGEAFLNKLYEVMNSTPEAREAWKKTVIVIAFDENGGIYDHVPPPWGATPPWGDSKPDFELEEGFGFNRFGVRVPMILVSPWVNEQTVFRSTTDVPFDHTSTIATILNWKGIDKSKWNLGERVANAPTWDGVLNRSQPRTDFPLFTVNEQTNVAAESSNDEAINPLQAKLLPKVLNKACGGQLDAEQLDEAAQTILSKAKTMNELHQAVAEFASKQTQTES